MYLSLLAPQCWHRVKVLVFTFPSSSWGMALSGPCQFFLVVASCYRNRREPDWLYLSWRELIQNLLWKRLLGTYFPTVLDAFLRGIEHRFFPRKYYFHSIYFNICVLICCARYSFHFSLRRVYLPLLPFLAKREFSTRIPQVVESRREKVKKGMNFSLSRYITIMILDAFSAIYCPTPWFWVLSSSDFSFS